MAVLRVNMFVPLSHNDVVDSCHSFAQLCKTMKLGAQPATLPFSAPPLSFGESLSWEV